MAPGPGRARAKPNSAASYDTLSESEIAGSPRAVQRNKKRVGRGVARRGSNRSVSSGRSSRSDRSDRDLGLSSDINSTASVNAAATSAAAAAPATDSHALKDGSGRHRPALKRRSYPRRVPDDNRGVKLSGRRVTSHHVSSMEHGGGGSGGGSGGGGGGGGGSSSRWSTTAKPSAQASTLQQLSMTSLGLGKRTARGGAKTPDTGLADDEMESDDGGAVPRLQGRTSRKVKASSPRRQPHNGGGMHDSSGGGPGGHGGGSGYAGSLGADQRQSRQMQARKAGRRRSTKFQDS